MLLKIFDAVFHLCAPGCNPGGVPQGCMCVCHLWYVVMGRLGNASVDGGVWEVVEGNVNSTSDWYLEQSMFPMSGLWDDGLGEQCIFPMIGMRDVWDGGLGSNECY